MNGRGRKMVKGEWTRKTNEETANWDANECTHS